MHFEASIWDVISPQYGMFGLQVGAAANPGPLRSVDEELLDGVLTIPRKVRRRVKDSDSDVLLVDVPHKSKCGGLGLGF